MNSAAFSIDKVIAKITDGENLLVLAILVLFLVGTLTIGVVSARLYKTRSTREFLTGGRGVNWWINGVAIFAAFASGGTMLGSLGLSYRLGWGYAIASNAGVAMGYLITSFFLAKVLRNMNVATVPAFIKARFRNRALNLMVPSIFIISLGAYVVAQMKVGGMIGERLFDIPYEYSLILIGAVYIFYTFLGGMKAVTMTDFFQGLLMISVIIMTGAIAWSTNGGGINSVKLANELRPIWSDNTRAALPLSAYVAGFLVWASVNAVLPHTVMRIFAAKHERSGRASLLFGLSMYIFTAAITCVSIVASAIIITQGAKLDNPDETFLIFLETVPNWLMAIAFAGIFAAVMSSVSAMLLGLSAAFSYDLIGELAPNMADANKRRLTKATILVFGVATLILAMNPPALLSLLFTAAMALLASALFFPVILGIWWKRMNSWGATWGAIAGGGTYIVLYLLGQLTDLVHFAPIVELNYAMPVSLVVCVVVALLTKPPTPADLYRISIAHQRPVTDQDEVAAERLFNSI